MGEKLLSSVEPVKVFIGKVSVHLRGMCDPADRERKTKEDGDNAASLI